MSDLPCLYIAGPMSGHSQFNFPAFDFAAGSLRSLGYTIISPAELDDPATRKAALASPDGAPGLGAANGESYGDFLSRDIKLVIDTVDGVCVLPEWYTSPGARLEVYAARLLEKPVYCIAPSGYPVRLSDYELDGATRDHLS